jgi:DNA-binding NtrC family response regulator
MPATPVLVVEDRSEIRQALISLLEYAGYSPSGASTCAEARELMEQATFRVALLDLKLPDGSGLALCDELRARAPQTRVVIISGDSAQVSEEQWKERGAVGFLNKPFGYAQLDALLRRVLGEGKGAPDKPAEP